MATIVGVRFHNAGKLYYFDPGKLWPTAGDAVIVETARGLDQCDTTHFRQRNISAHIG